LERSEEGGNDGLNPPGAESRGAINGGGCPIRRPCPEIVVLNCKLPCCIENCVVDCFKTLSERIVGLVILAWAVLAGIIPSGFGEGVEVAPGASRGVLGMPPSSEELRERA
jgi:hypothetical protein